LTSCGGRWFNFLKHSSGGSAFAPLGATAD
jgi:hypothetical protein